MKRQGITPKAVPGRAATVCPCVNRFGRAPGGGLLARAGRILRLDLPDDVVVVENPASMINP